MSPMRSSFRRRLLVIAALTLLVCGAAIAAISILAQASAEERTEHARENVTREVERLRSSVAAMPRNVRPRAQSQSGELRSGYVESASDVGADKFLIPVIAQSTSNGDVVAIAAIDVDGIPLRIAVAPIGGGWVYAFQRVVAGRETRDLRSVILVLAVLALILIASSLRTLSVVERDVFALRETLAHLTNDLKSPVARASLRELDEVAQGIASLAKELDRAQEERERLTRELGDRERLAALGRVAAGIAHEVRNPLAAMKLRADLARTSGDATPAISKDLEDIASEISRLDRLVSDLLVVSGRRSGPRTETEVSELVAKRVALLSPWANEKKITITQSGKAKASIDADAFARVIDNVLRNAIEASKQGQSVTVQIVREDDDTRIDVIDHGQGVSETRAAELFEPFFTTKPDGTGLGLALARAVVAAHGGTLTYTRASAETKFTIAISSKNEAGKCDEVS
jgi:signal transduction histidine kinase